MPTARSAALENGPAVAKVASITDLAGFGALERQWNSLVAAHNDSLFLRHEFLSVWLNSFARQDRLEILTGLSDDNELIAALPLLRKHGSIRGIPVRQIISTCNSHSCRFDMIAENPADAGEAFLRHLEERKDWDVLQIADVPEDGHAWHLYRAAIAKGYPAGTWAAQRSPYLLLPSSEEELQDCVSTQLRSTARRKQRHMEKRGATRIDRIEGGALSLALEDFFKLERSGWKGRNGTACDQDEHTRSFYKNLADVAAGKNWLSCFRLSLDGETAAFHYGLTYNGVYLLPKLAFREEFSDLSPGLVLMHEVLLDCMARKLNAIDFLGSDDEWKTRWSRTVLPHHWLYIFANTWKGRLLHNMKFKWAHLAKGIFKGASN